MSNVTSISIEHDSRSYYDSHKDITLVTQNFSPYMHAIFCNSFLYIFGSVADPDPGSGASFTPWIRDLE
jgi:hypothetical protein